jgi:DNA-binding MarR family transcriptional regulator
MNIKEFAAKTIEALPALLAKLVEDFHKIDEMTDLNPQAIRVLLVLSIMQEHMRQERVVMSVIQKRIGLGEDALPPILDQLYKKGYLNGERAESERHEVLISLTPEGIEEAQKLSNALLRNVQLRLERLDEEELDRFFQAIDTLYRLHTKL